MRVTVSPQGGIDAVEALTASMQTIFGACSASNGVRITAACSTAAPLSEYLSERPSTGLTINECIHLIDDLCAQIDNLARSGWGILSLSTADILMVDTRYAICSARAIERISGGRIEVTPEARTKEFIAPEVAAEINGQTVDVRCICFSVGRLVTHVLFLGTEAPPSVPMGSKLYWFLDRTMRLDAAARSLLLL
jgi:hypothetical protein